MSNDIFVQYNTRSGMLTFFDAELPEDAVENAPEHVLFIPIDEYATFPGGVYDEELTNWFIVTFIVDGRKMTRIMTHDDITGYLHRHISELNDTVTLLSVERLTKENFNGTPFFVEIGDI